MTLLLGKVCMGGLAFPFPVSKFPRSTVDLKGWKVRAPKMRLR